MPQKSNVYTRGGDRGQTSLVGGTRVSKDSAPLEAYGTVDELNSWLGLLLAEPEVLPEGASETLHRMQNALFDIGAILATERDSGWQPAPLPASLLTDLEGVIDTLDAALPSHNRFILPGGVPAAARAQIARTVARRAERRIIALDAVEPLRDPLVLPLINRLSDYLFVLARAINHKNKAGSEIFWEKSC